MKRIITYTLIINLFCCTYGWSQESFEGMITYKVDIVFKTKNAPHKDYTIEKFGDTLQVFFNKKGDMYRKFIGTGSKGFDFQLYEANTNKFYAKWKNLDTLYYLDASVNALKLISKETGTSTPLLNKPSKYILIKGYIPETKETVNQKFYYTGFPYLDPTLFKNFKEFFSNEILQASKSPFLKFELELDDYIITYTALRIEKKFLSPKIFKIPRNIPQKKS